MCQKVAGGQENAYHRNEIQDLLHDVKTRLENLVKENGFLFLTILWLNYWLFIICFRKNIEQRQFYVFLN